MATLAQKLRRLSRAISPLLERELGIAPRERRQRQLVNTAYPCGHTVLHWRSQKPSKDCFKCRVYNSPLYREWQAKKEA